ncbi:MAG: serine/threonine protein kinase [Candidatus Wallbacteria bacterium]|nr:serine/threonine protein kinase [Candidatus Wallbacteria bacterium]
MTTAKDSKASGQLIASSYKVIAKIGSGAMGSVYRARQLSLNRDVALKLLKTEIAAGLSGRKRFEREAAILTKLSHPNLVPVYDVGLDGEEPYIAMELIDGPSLADWLEQKAEIPRPDPAAIARDLATGLAYIHSQGVFHRDIKPANILLKDGRHAMLADFGLARSQGASGLTTAGFVVGTPAYLAPEQLATPVYNESTDLYQLALVLYEVIVGKSFFSSGANLQQVVAARLEGRVPDLMKVAPDCPPILARAVMRCLAKDPGLRFQSSAELVDALALIPSASSEQIPVSRTALTPARSSSRRTSAGTPSGTQLRRAELPQRSNSKRYSGAALVVGLLLFLVGGTLQNRSATSTSKASSLRQLPPDVSIDVTEWAYDPTAQRLRVGTKVSRSVAAGWRVSTGPVHATSGGAAAWVEADFPYRPDQPFSLAILRSDGGPELTLTEADLVRFLRGAGERLTRTLRDFWTRSGLTDQRFVDRLRQELGELAMTDARRKVASQTLVSVLGKMKLLEPVRQILPVAPLFFDATSIPYVERAALYRLLAPLELADCLARHRGLSFPFGQPLASSTGSSLAQMAQPDASRSRNYLVYVADLGSLLERSFLLHFPKPVVATRALLGSVYRLDSGGVLKLLVGGIPIYLSQAPQATKSSGFQLPSSLSFELPGTKRVEDGKADSRATVVVSPSLGEPIDKCAPYGIQKITVTVAGHRVPPELLAADLRVDVSKIRLQQPGPFDEDNVALVWLGVDLAP